MSPKLEGFTAASVRLQLAGGQLLIEVLDNGPGVPEGLRRSVFERFVRGESPAATGQGDGCGLSTGAALP